MIRIINDPDANSNTPLHYAKSYSDQNVAKFLLAYDAKFDKNPQDIPNVLPKTLDEYFYEQCVSTVGDEIDDEDFRIKINLKFFEGFDHSGEMKLRRNSMKPPGKNAWGLNDEEAQKKEDYSTGKVDTRRLKYLSENSSFHFLLKHPVMSAFLEIELNSLKMGYVVDFIIYLTFVTILFIHLGNKYGIFDQLNYIVFRVLIVDDIPWDVSSSGLALFGILIVLCLRESYQIWRLKKKYFLAIQNYFEWLITALVIITLSPLNIVIEDDRKGMDEFHRHMSALTILLAFMQLYILLVRVVPNSPIPIYINMFTTVLKTYTFILMSYMAFILSFAYSFYLILGNHANNDFTSYGGSAVNTNNSTNATSTETNNFGHIGKSIIRTIVMFTGEFDYTDIEFNHWVGYVIFVMFVFLLVVVLMNILNGLAVSDISKIQEEVDTYYHVSIIETLSYTSNVKLLADEIVIFPNKKPSSQKMCGISIPGFKVYRVEGHTKGSSEVQIFFLNEGTVKAAKELVTVKNEQRQILGKKVSLNSVAQSINDLKKENAILHRKIEKIFDMMKRMQEIQISRNPIVEHI